MKKNDSLRIGYFCQFLLAFGMTELRRYVYRPFIYANNIMISALPIHKLCAPRQYAGPIDGEVAWLLPEGRPPTGAARLSTSNMNSQNKAL